MALEPPKRIDDEFEDEKIVEEEEIEQVEDLYGINSSGINLDGSVDFSFELVKSQDLTFEQICPIWSGIVRENVWNKISVERRGFYAEILHKKAETCFVGEAWKWSGDWNYDSGGCGICAEFGRMHGVNSLIAPISKYGVDWNLFHERQQLFVDHFNECHRC